MPLQNSLKTIAGLTFEELYERAGLVKLNAKFEEYLQVKNKDLFQKFSTLQQGGPRHEDGVTILPRRHPVFMTGSSPHGKFIILTNANRTKRFRKTSSR